MLGFGNSVVMFLLITSVHGVGGPLIILRLLKQRVSIICVLVSWDPSVYFRHPSLFGRGSLLRPSGPVLPFASLLKTGHG